MNPLNKTLVIHRDRLRSLANTTYVAGHCIYPKSEISRDLQEIIFISLDYTALISNDISQHLKKGYDVTINQVGYESY